MGITEVIAVLFSLICIVLAVKKHVLNWPAGLIGVSAYLLLFYRERLYADMVLQIVFIGQGIYGWYNWQFNKERQEELAVSFLSNRQRLLYLLLIVACWLSWFVLLQRFTNASMPLVDALAATISLVANWLMARRHIENWLLWMVVDLIYIALFWYKNLYLSSGIYAVFLLLSLKGWIDWSRKRNIQRVSS